MTNPRFFVQKNRPTFNHGVKTPIQQVPLVHEKTPAVKQYSHTPVEQVPLVAQAPVPVEQASLVAQAPVSVVSQARSPVVPRAPTSVFAQAPTSVVAQAQTPVQHNFPLPVEQTPNVQQHFLVPIEQTPIVQHFPLTVEQIPVVQEHLLTPFSCTGRRFGYFADIQHNCKIYHVCNPLAGPSEPEGTHYTFNCPATTLFDQRYHTCVPESLALDCSQSESYFTQTETRFSA